MKYEIIHLSIREDDLTILVDLANSARLGNFGQIFSMRELEAFDRIVHPDEEGGL